MTLTEAVNSGKEFKRKLLSESTWIRVGAGGLLFFVDNGHTAFFDKDDITADDYEVRE
jgi:hypothetical protein